MNGAKTTIKSIVEKVANDSKKAANGILTRMPEAKKKTYSLRLGL